LLILSGLVTSNYMPDDTVVVPPGHKVVVFRSSPKSFFARAESGVWILNFGDDQHDVEASLSKLDLSVLSSGAPAVVWLLSERLLNSLGTHGWLVSKAEGLLNALPQKSRLCAVFPNHFPPQSDFVRALKSVGASVHLAAADSACFVEVHRPDGIVLGFPGQTC
jgi:hypothetical protein